MTTDSRDSVLEQLNDDFKYAKGNFDTILETAVEDLSKLTAEAKNEAKKAHKRFAQFAETRALSDQIAAMFNQFENKIAQGFEQSSPKMQRELASKLAAVCVSVIEMNPANTRAVKKVADGILNGYDNNPQPDTEVYKALQKIYAEAFRNTGHKENADAVNLISDKMNVLKGNTTADNFLKRLQGDNPKTADLHNFENSLKKQLETNPEQGGKDLFGYITEIVKIKDKELRTQAFEVVLQNLKKVLEASVKEATQSRADMQLVESGMFKIFEIEEAVGLSEKAEANRTPFERHTHDKFKKEMKVRANQERIAKQIYTLLNLTNEQVGVKRQDGKPFYPSKKEMLKVANLLEQYKGLDYGMSMDISIRIDDKHFSNIDDKFIDKILALKGENADKLKADLMQIRTKMHSKGIPSKQQTAPTETKTVKMEPKAQANKAIFDLKDMKKGNSYEK